MRSHRAVSRLGAAAMLLSILCGVVGCAVDEPPLETSDDAQTGTTKERTLLFADDDASRVACRDVTNRYFCSEEDARSAARACATSASGAPTSLSSLRSPIACSKSGELYPTVGSCETPIPRHCGFYSACLERALPCGEDGYALGFGERFCTAFRNAKLSDKGTAWTTGVMDCLERALVPRVAAAGAFTTRPESAAVCEEVSAEAFASHPGCYTRPEHSICFLPPADLLTILATIGATELFTLRTGSQVVTTAGLCVGQIAQEIARRVFGDGPSPLESAVSSRGASTDLDLRALDAQRQLFEELAQRPAASRQ
jgi:hypothetical protein